MTELMRVLRPILEADRRGYERGRAEGRAEALHEGYLAGFQASREGFNGEYGGVCSEALEAMAAEFAAAVLNERTPDG